MAIGTSATARAKKLDDAEKKALGMGPSTAKPAAPAEPKDTLSPSAVREAARKKGEAKREAANAKQLKDDLAAIAKMKANKSK